jgi:putative transposase
MEASQVERVGLIWVDGGYRGNPFAQWVMDVWRWIVVVVLRPEQMQGFQVLKKRWVVERTFGWWHGARRLSRDYEHQPLSSEAMMYLANIRLMVRRLA